MIKHILVLGGGSAGFLAAITCKVKLPGAKITLLRSPGIGIIGVGEGTIPTVPKYLHGYLGIDLGEFYREANPSWKLGIRFVWGPRPYFNYTFTDQVDLKYQVLPKPMGFYFGDDMRYGEIASALMTEDRVFMRQDNGWPVIREDTAYHLENETFVAYLEKHATAVGVEIVEGTVVNVLQEERGVTGLRLEGNSTIEADFFIDCSGFRSVLLGQTMKEPFIDFKSSLLCNTAVVGGWPRSGEEPIKPYTTSETMDHGWCWQIEHEHHITRGYVYSTDFVSDDEAEAEFRRKNPKIESTRIVRFKTGRYRNMWIKNVVAIGNAGGFVEPLESTALGVICTECQGVVECLRDSDRQIFPSLTAAYNKRSAASWDTIRAFLAVHYRFNTRCETPFWQACRNDVELGMAQEIVDYYQDNGPSTIWRKTIVHPTDQFQLDGYLTLLVGQKVPYRRHYTPSPQELEAFTRLQGIFHKRAANGVTCEEALQMIRSPNWQWNPGIYSQ